MKTITVDVTDGNVTLEAGQKDVHDAQLDEHRPEKQPVVALKYASSLRRARAARMFATGGRRGPTEGGIMRFHVAVAASLSLTGCSFRPAASLVASSPDMGPGTTDVRRATCSFA